MSAVRPSGVDADSRTDDGTTRGSRRMPAAARATAPRTAVRSGPCSTTTAVVSEAAGKCAASRWSAVCTSVPGTVCPCENRPPTVAASTVETAATASQRAATASGCAAHQPPRRCNSRVTGARLGGPLNSQEQAPDPWGMSSAMAEPTSPTTPSRRRVLRRVGAVLLRVAPVIGLVVAVGTWSHLPKMHLQPALLGLACWTVGNYLFCPLRWRAVSTRGKKWSWYARVYAEGELLGMLTPQHAGADLWRIRQLLHAGSDKSAAVVEVAADRLSGGLIVAVLAVLAGVALPPALLPIAGGALAAVALTAYLVRRLWLHRVRDVARPRGWALVRAALISGLYQAV